MRAKIAAALASTSYGALAGGAMDLRQVHLPGSLRTGNLEPRDVMPEPQIREQLSVRRVNCDACASSQHCTGCQPAVSSIAGEGAPSGALAVGLRSPAAGSHALTSKPSALVITLRAEVSKSAVASSFPLPGRKLL